MKLAVLLPVVHLPLLGILQAQAPQFQSLTPSNQAQAQWVAHLNNMKEAERRERVRTFGMPPAPPNRWLKPHPPVPGRSQKVQSAPQSRTPPPVQRYRPAPPPRPRPAVVKPKVVPAMAKAKPAEQPAKTNVKKTAKHVIRISKQLCKIISLSSE